MMDTNLCPSSPAPPPYQLHTSPLPSDVVSADRPLSSLSVANGLRYSTIHTSSRFSDASLPIYENYCDPPSSSSPSGNELAPEQLRNGLKALFQVSTPLASRPRPASRATTVSAVSITNRDSVTEPGQGEKRHSAVSEFAGRANSDPRGQLRPRSSAHMVGSTMDTRDRAISELYDHKQDTHVSSLERIRRSIILTRKTIKYTTKHAFDPFLAELDGTVPVPTPVELDNTEPRYTVAELDAGTEEAVKLVKPKTQTGSPEIENSREKIVAVTGPCASDSMTESQETLSSPSSTETGQMDMFEDRVAQAEWLRRSSILQP
ncbi:hypothetical protein PG984_002737 [Apiospora sp. TS-2023a]